MRTPGCGRKVFSMGLKAIVKKNKAVYKTALLLRKATHPFLRFAMCACHALRGVDKNKVYFSCFHGRMYNESPKYICEALHEIYPDAKFVFRLNKHGMNQPDIPPYVIKVPQMSLKMLYHMSTARVIVKNTCRPGTVTAASSASPWTPSRISRTALRITNTWIWA